MKKKTIQIILVVVMIFFVISGTTLIINFNKGRRDVFDIEISDDVIIKTKYCEFDNGNFSIKIPINFKTMSDKVREVKYSHDKSPSIVYTNEDASINIAVNLTDEKIDNIKDYTNLVRNVFDPIYKDVEVNIFDYENHQIGEVKLISPADDTYIYNHMIFFTVDGNLKIITFNCTFDLMDDWKKVGEFIMDSLVFKS
ncbi:MAG: hypothetical protein J6A52_00780 [Bacilli bacterium]|nr:hypothetical protein [Bacilli bacterium]